MGRKILDENERGETNGLLLRLPQKRTEVLSLTFLKGVSFTSSNIFLKHLIGYKPINKLMKKCFKVLFRKL